MTPISPNSSAHLEISPTSADQTDLGHQPSQHVESPNSLSVSNLLKNVRLDELAEQIANAPTAPFEDLMVVKVVATQVIEELDNSAVASLRLSSNTLRACVPINAVEVTIKHDKDLEILAKNYAQYSKLRKLTLGPNITDQGLTHLKYITQLTHVTARYCPNISNSGLANLMHLKELTYLDLSGLREITATLVTQLKTLEKLSDLNLALDFPMETNNIAQIMQVQSNFSMQTLSTSLHASVNDELSRFYCRPMPWTSTGGLPNNLSELTNLRSLNLSDRDVSDKFLTQIANLKQLTRLNLKNNPHITGKVLKALENLPLAELDLTGCNLISQVDVNNLKENTTSANLTIKT